MPVLFRVLSLKFKVQSAGFWFRGFWFLVSRFRRPGPQDHRATAPQDKKKSRRRPTLARAGPALPSAMRRLTSVFGMGTGMAASLWPPANGRCRESPKWGRAATRRGGTGRQASRAISTARLNASLRFHRRPIEVVVYDRAWGHFWREDLSWGRLGA